MKYPQHFVDAAKKIIPNDLALHESIETGNPDIGKLLNEYMSNIYELEKEWIALVGQHFKEQEQSSKEYPLYKGE